MFRYLFWDRPIVDQVNYALEIAADSQRPIGCLWQDCEEMDTNMPPEATHLVELIQLAVDTTTGVPEVGVYSRRNWWETRTRNSTRFAGLPLWDANDGEFIPYGGWTEAQMTQYAWDQMLAGRNVDLNRY